MLKKCVWLRAVPKKSKKCHAKTLLLKIWSTPIALPASRSDLLLSLVFYFLMKNLSFRSGLSLKSPKNVKQKQQFYKKQTHLSHLRLFAAYFPQSFLGGVFQNYRRIDPPAAVIGNCQFSSERAMMFLRLSLKPLIFFKKKR